MPSYYTHFYFAQKCAERFPAKLKEIVDANRKYYDLGSGGADVLFFYKPYKKNDIRSYGSYLHRENFISQMQRFKECADGSCHSDRDIAYLVGYFTHFVLDSAAHPYIDKVVSENVEKHFVIETDYERKLLIKNGLDPYSNKYIVKTGDEDVIETVSKYMNTTPKIIKNTLKDRRKFIGIISSQNKLVRSFLKFAFKISGNPAGFDVLVQGRENPRCEAVRERLDAIIATALGDIERLSAEFFEYISSSSQLGERFDCDFHGCRQL